MLADQEMARTRIFLITLVGAGLMFLSGCPTVRGTADVSIDQSSPEALAASVHEAIESRNFAAMLECMEPSKQAQYDRMLVAVRRAWRKILLVASLVDEKIGRKEADRVLKGAKDNLLPSPFSEAVVDGQVDWSKVRFKTERDTAWAGSIHGTTWFTAKRIDSKWYMTHESEEVPFEKAVEFQRRRAETGAWAAGRYIRDIRSGRINKDNVDEKLFGWEKGTAERVARWAATPYGEPVGGVRIRITTWAPTFRRDERLRFEVEIKYEKPGLVCWRVPDGGLGENIIVEIDGKPIQQPDVKADSICGNFDGTQHGYGIVLPEDLKLTPASHTIRYTIVSAGGTYTHRDGRKIGIIKGNLVSNTVTFVIEE